MASGGRLGGICSGQLRGLSDLKPHEPANRDFVVELLRDLRDVLGSNLLGRGGPGGVCAQREGSAGNRRPSARG